MAHRLADTTSPYLRQHAQNPVDWWPWGSEAFDEATRRDVPVFVSIGRAACHWWHVMALTEAWTLLGEDRLLDRALYRAGGGTGRTGRGRWWRPSSGRWWSRPTTGPDAAGPAPAGSGDAVPAGDHPGDGMDPDDVTAGRHSRDGPLVLYLCRGSMCHAPVGEIGDVERLSGPAGPDSGPNSP